MTDIATHPRDTSRINTTAVRRMAESHANWHRRRNEPPGAVLTGTVPGLCDEVDRLRAIVARVEALADREDARVDERNAYREAHGMFSPKSGRPIRLVGMVSTADVRDALAGA